MKHLPNLLTLTNLFCGCIAIAYILNAQPFTYLNMQDGLPTWNWVFGIQQVFWGSIFIGIAAICDMLDGLAARALKVFSPIGKDLDSLADVVSFGVAPSVIIFKMLWDACMGERNAMDVPMIAMMPAFLIACFAALRLARFNIVSETHKGYFVGMPTPAIGILVASLPWVARYNIFNIPALFQNKWFLYFIIALLCWLMVAKVRFFKLVPSRWSFAAAWPQYVLIIVGLPALWLLQFLAIPLLFVLYILLSLIYRQPEIIQNNN